MQFQRFENLIGEENFKKLNDKKVILFGLGGVGGIIAETLVRSGILNICVVDGDIVDITNLNRQIIATHKTVGQKKVDVIKKRLQDINPNVNVKCVDMFVTPNDVDDLIDGYDYIIDAIDTISTKIALAVSAENKGINIISAMSAGNKLFANFEVQDIYKTSYCPICKVMRYELKKLGVKHLKVVYTKTQTDVKGMVLNGKVVPTSSAFSPNMCGLTIASEVVKDMIKKH